MKESQRMAMMARKRAERNERFAGYGLADVEMMDTTELTEFIAWVGRQMPNATGARYAYLDLLEDFAREELTER